MMEIGVAALTEIAMRDDIHVVVVKGNGRSFCAGGDLDQMRAMIEADLADFDMQQSLKDQRLAHEFSRLLHDMPKVTVAAINGYATGAGLGIALSCDLRVAASDSGFGSAFTGVGLDGDLGVSWTLAKLVGESKAKEIMFFPAPFDVAEAKRLGLVNFVAEAGKLEEEVARVTGRLAAGPQTAFGYIKANINAVHQESFAASLEREAMTHVSLMYTDDFHEGVAAVLEKRRPIFGKK
jgi:2-(1,2-epoxy-1,2-dihydrophenyl)acetyl-CoA isomerase